MDRKKVDFDSASFGVRSGQYSSLRQVSSRRLTDGKYVPGNVTIAAWMGSCRCVAVAGACRLWPNLLYAAKVLDLHTRCGHPRVRAGAGGRPTCGSQNCKNSRANDIAQRYELLKDSIYTLGGLSVAADRI